MTQSCRLSRRRFLAAAGVVPAAVALGWPGRGRSATATLRVSSSADLQVLDPAFLISSQELNQLELMLRRLVSFKGRADTSVEMDAAETVEQVDPLHVKFTLMKGIAWSDGFGELTAEDVKFSFERVIDPALKSPYAGDWAALDHVEVTGSHAGILVLKEPSATLWTIALPGWSGLIVCKKAVEALPGRQIRTQVPAVAGPYRMKEWVPKQRTVYVPNPAWSGAPASWAEIVITPIDDPNASELAYEAKEVDLSRLSLATLARYKKEGTPAGSKVIEMPSLAYVWLGMNIDNPALKDIRVRRAIQKAVDVKATVEAAYFGVAEPSTGIVAPSLIGHRNIPPMQRDVEGARKLLAEAGVDHLGLTLDIANDMQRVLAAQVIQASLAEVGIDVTINKHDSGVMDTLGQESAGPGWKDIQLILNRFSMSPDPSWATEWFTPEQIGVWNWERFNSQEFGTLHKQAKAELDPEKRAGLYRRMQDLMEDSGAYVFLTHELRAYICRDGVVPEFKPDGEPMFAKFRPA
ncbi:MAG: ABC transporter substrate-binding protein [Dongiaceae bacterium]